MKEWFLAFILGPKSLALVILVAIGGAIFPVLGLVIGSHWRGRPPVEVGVYLPWEGAVTLRFLRPAFQERIRSVGGNGT
jgi:hypothetical protein